MGSAVGSKVAAVAQMFSQGNISVTSNPLDVAINGKGFFRLDGNGAVTYSRNGQFRFDSQGFLVNNQGLSLTGNLADGNGNILPAAPAPIQISFADIAPQTTTEFRLGMNFDARQSQPSVTTFDPDSPQSYNFSTSGSVFDTLGNAHVFSLYMVKTATAGEWDMYAAVDGEMADADLGGGLGSPVTLTFDSSGNLWITEWESPDSRLYRFRNGELEQLTHDHSFSQELLDAGMVTEEEAKLLPSKNLVTRALGAGGEVEPEVNDYPLRIGDVLMLCSDGLTEMVDDVQIAGAIFASVPDVQRAAQRLLDMANAAGGRDNVSVIVVRLAGRKGLEPRRASAAEVRSSVASKAASPSG